MSDDESRWRYLGAAAKRAARGRSATTRGEWEGLKANPTDHDLGYAPDNWDRTEDGRGRVVFLPRDPDVIADNEFIIADESAVEDVGRRF